MAIPLDPSNTSIVTEGLKRGGRVNPTATQITAALDTALQEVKADIMLRAPTHPNLLAASTTTARAGQQRYAIPPDFNEPYSIALLEGPTDWAGTARGAVGDSILLSLSMTASAQDLLGKYILLTEGPGVEEYRQILAYDEGLKIATVDVAWVTNPTTLTKYQVLNASYPLWPSDIRSELDTYTNPTILGRPYRASIFDQEFVLYPVPDRVYGLRARYWVDLSMLDETGPLFVQLLREWRSLWIQGVAVKTMQRYDEDRYLSELQIYENYLTLLSSQAASIGQVVFRDI